MKTNRFALLVAACSLFPFSTAGCAEKAKPETTPPAVTAPDTAVPPPPPAAKVAPVQWSTLKGYSYDMRDQLLAGLTNLETQVDEQISELTAKRAALDASNTSTQAWDFAMKEMTEARTNLKSTNDDLAKATRETWDQGKEKVGAAWTRTQDAYAKVIASTTK